MPTHPTLPSGIEAHISNFQPDKEKMAVTSDNREWGALLWNTEDKGPKKVWTVGDIPPGKKKVLRQWFINNHEEIFNQ